MCLVRYHLNDIQLRLYDFLTKSLWRLKIIFREQENKKEALNPFLMKASASRNDRFMYANNIASSELPQKLMASEEYLTRCLMRILMVIN